MMHSWRVPSGEVGSGFGEVRGGATSEGVFSVFHLVFNFVVASTHASEYLVSGTVTSFNLLSTCCWTGTGWCENST